MSSTRYLGKFALGLGLGVALTVAATQAWSVTAAPGDTDSTFVPVAPCRLLDTRPGLPPLGGTKTPIGPGTANTITQQVTGIVGDCDIPSDAVAVAANVTAVAPTAQSNLRLYPANEAVPNAANLNFVAGQAPTPNLVTVKLSPDGKVKLFNQNGTVNVIIDVAGYYTPESLTDIDTRLAALEADAPGSGSGGAIVEYASATDVPPQLDESAVVDEKIAATQQLTLTLVAPSSGKISLVANATAKSGSSGRARLVCQITDDPSSTTIDVNEVLGIAAPSSGGAQPSLGTNRVFDVAAGSNTFDLMCAGTANQGDDIIESVEIHYRSMTALFTPAA